MALFAPTVYRRRITDISVSLLKRLGVRGILLDIDNTLTTHDNPQIDTAVTAWLSAVQAAGFTAVVVSNNQAARVAPFAQKIGLSYQAKAAKPLPKGYRAAARMLGLPPRQCAVIGDQIFTDILGANLAGMPSILLEPIQAEVDQKFIVFKRRLERPLLNRPRQRKKREADYRG